MMICNDCKYKQDCQLYSNRTYQHRDSCQYKDIEEINSATKTIDSILSRAKENDKEFYSELLGIFSP